MESNLGTVSHWIANVKQGDQSALANLHRRYWPQLVQIAGKRLNFAPIHDRDAEDIAQDAFISMYQSLQAGKTPRLKNRHQWLAFLTHIIACRAVNEIRRATARKRGGLGQKEIGSHDIAVLDKSYSPQQQAILRDCYRYYVDSLPDHLREFAEFHLAGLNNSEIAEKLDCVRRTADRKLKLLKMYWKKIAVDELERSLDDTGPENVMPNQPEMSQDVPGK